MINKYYLYISVILLSIYCTNCDDQESTKKYCNNDADCMDEQVCHVKQCTCKPRFISNGIYCFPEAKHNDQCWFDEQCLDHRESCVRVQNELMRCQCDQFHEYDSISEHCVPKRNLTDMLVEKHNHQGTIEGQAQTTYSVILICGLTLAAVGATFLAIALIYCYHMHVSDTKLHKNVDALAEKLGKTNPVLKRDLESDEKRNEAAVVPIIQDNMIIGDF